MLRRLLGAVLLCAAIPVLAQTEFKLATLAPEGTAWMREMRAVADTIKQRTDGRVSFRIYPGGVMGNDAVVLRKMRVGQLHGGAFTGSELASIYPDMMIYGLPFLFRNDAEVTAVRDAMDPRLTDGLREKGLEAVAIIGGGYAYMLSTQPIRGRDDLVKSKAWLPTGDIVSEATYKAAGVNPVPLSIADVYTSLQTGLVDTVANTPSGTIAFQWHTRVRHMVDMPIAYLVGIVALDGRTFAKLSDEDKTLVREVFTEAGKRLEQQTARDDQSAREALKGEGITFFEPDGEAVAYWRSIGEQAANDLMQRKVFARENHDAMMAALRGVRGE